MLENHPTGSSNLPDTSVIVEPEELNINDNNNADDYEFSFSAKDGLRRNLTQAFDKHVHSGTSNHGMDQAIAAAAASKRKPPLAPPHHPLADTSNTSTGTAMGPSVATLVTDNSGNAMNKRHMSVFLRVRPPVADSEQGILNSVEIVPPPPAFDPSCSGGVAMAYSGLCKTIRTNPPLQSNAAKVERGVKEYLFSGIFGPTASQQELYRTIAAPLVDGLFHGNPNECTTGSQHDQMSLQQGNDQTSSRASESMPPPNIGQSALLFAYGITNAGKTHTILGNIQSKTQKTWGIVPKSLQDIFCRMEACPNQFDLSLSYFEIYQDQIYDLLPKNPSIRPETLKLRERGEQVIIRGLARHRLRDISHALSLVQEAHRRRHTSSNNLNRDSSRSHCICQIELVVRQHSFAKINEDDNDDASVATMSGYTTDDEVMMQRKRQSATLWIVDLAGIERNKRTNAEALRQKEASLINQSLTNLMRCLTLLRESPNSQLRTTRMKRIPFRESKLTHLFMNHFLQTGAARTRMIVNINPAAADYDETQHVLHYASLARKVVQLDAEATRIVRPLPPSQRHNQHPSSLGRSMKNTASTNTVSGSTKWAASAGAAAKKAIIQVVRKLSPKRNQAQLGKTQQALRKRVAANKTNDTSSNTFSIASGNDANLRPPTKRIRTKDVDFQAAADAPLPVLEQVQTACVADLNRQIQSLETALSVAQAENQVLRYELQHQAEVMDKLEEKIRLEVAEEMDSQMNAMRQHYDNILMRINSQPQLGGFAISANEEVEAEDYYDDDLAQGDEDDDGNEEEEGEEDCDDVADDDTVKADDAKPNTATEQPTIPLCIN